VMLFDVITIFPGIFESPLRESLLGRAIEAGLLDVRVHDLRDNTIDKHRQVDDESIGFGECGAHHVVAGHDRRRLAPGDFHGDDAEERGDVGERGGEARAVVERPARDQPGGDVAADQRRADAPGRPVSRRPAGAAPVHGC